MVDRIEDRNNLAAHVEGVRHKNCSRQDLADGFGNGGLAVAGRPVDKHGSTGTDRRAQAVDHMVADDDVGKRRLHDDLVDGDILDGLVFNHLLVIFENNGSRAYVATDFHQLAGDSFTGCSGNEVKRRLNELACATHFHQLLAA